MDRQPASGQVQTNTRIKSMAVLPNIAQHLEKLINCSLREAMFVAKLCTSNLTWKCLLQHVTSLPVVHLILLLQVVSQAALHNVTVPDSEGLFQVPTTRLPRKLSVCD